MHSVQDAGLLGEHYWQPSIQLRNRPAEKQL